MNIAHAIARFDTLYPNVFPYAEKLRWLSVFDGTVFSEIISRYAEDAGTFEGYTVQTDKHTELLIPFPHDDIYIKYLAAQNDKISSDVERYANSSAVFNTAYSEFAADYNRKHSMPGVRLRYEYE